MIELVVIVAPSDTLSVPSKLIEGAVTKSPVILKFLDVSNLVAVEAIPVTFPLKLPSNVVAVMIPVTLLVIKPAPLVSWSVLVNDVVI